MDKRLVEIIGFLKGTINKENGYSDYLIDSLKYLIEQAEKSQEFEKFAKTYYNCFLDSRHLNENRRISHNDQYFLYARANKLLGEPNGKRLD